MTFKEKVTPCILFFLIFLVFFYIFNHVPLINDAWINADIYHQKGGFLEWVRSSVFWYKLVNGRFIANVVIGFFEQSKHITDVVNAATMTTIIFLTHKLFGSKTKQGDLTLLICTTLFFLVSKGLRLEVYFYANLIYTLPVLTILTFIYLFNQVLTNQSISNTRRKILFVSAFISSAWIEHISFGFFSSLLILSVFAARNLPNIKTDLIKLNLFSFVGLLSMFLSPGLYHSRAIVDKSAPFFEGIAVNGTINFSQIFLDNAEIITMTCLAIFILVLKSREPNKRTKLDWLLLTTNFLAFLFFFSVLLKSYLISTSQNWSLFNRTLGRLATDYPSSTSDASILQWKPMFFSDMAKLSIFSLCFIFSLTLASRYVKKIYSYIFLLLIAAFSIFPLFISPNTGYRISSIAVFMLIPISVSLWSSVNFAKDNSMKAFTYIFAFILFLGLDKYNLILNEISKVSEARSEIIQNARIMQNLQQWKYDDVLILPSFSGNSLWKKASPPPGTFYYPHFLSYNGLNQNTLIDYDSLVHSISTFVKDRQLKITVDIPNPENYQISFSVLRDDQEILRTPSQRDATSVTINIPYVLSSGRYRIVCKLENRNLKTYLSNPTDANIL